MPQAYLSLPEGSLRKLLVDRKWSEMKRTSRDRRRFTAIRLGFLQNAARL